MGGHYGNMCTKEFEKRFGIAGTGEYTVRQNAAQITAAYINARRNTKRYLGANFLTR